MLRTLQPLSLRFALRDLRSGLAGFRIFLACLAIGVGAIAAVGSLNEALHAGLRENGRAILGGDLSVRLSYRPPSADQQATLEAMGATTQVVDMRTMVRTVGDDPRRLLVQLKGVQPSYPLVGKLVLRGGGTLDDALALKDEFYGAAVGPTLLDRLGVKVGDRIRLGNLDVQIRDVIESEPDDLSGGLGMQMGPRVMVRSEAVAAAGLIQPGTMVEYTTAVRFDTGALDPKVARDALAKAHPEAGWRVRTPGDAGLSFQVFIDQLSLFLTLVGLIALLVGGIGIANAIKAHLESRLRTIAIFKSVGASNSNIFRIYLIQLLLIAALGILMGVAVGALAPVALVAFGGDMLPLPAGVPFFPGPLLEAAAFGLLVTLAFALGPLARADLISPALLFRNDTDVPDPRLRWRDVMGVGGVSLALVALIIATSNDRSMAAWFVAASLGAFALFQMIARGVTLLARITRLPAGYPALRLGLASLRRPGGPTTAIMLSLGLGLSVLVSIALVERSMTAQIGQGLPKDAPSFYFIDLQPDQVEPFRQAVLTVDPTVHIDMTDTVRGRFKAINGVPIDEEKVAPGVRWAVQSDRGFRTATHVPEGSTLKDGQWWPEDYQGETLFSVTSDIANGMNLKIGDKLTVNILGRDLVGTLASTRRVDWMSLKMNFSFVASPGAFPGAPRTWTASLYTDGKSLRAIEAVVGEQFPNVTIIDVRGVLSLVGDVLKKISLTVNVTALLTLVCGLLVLAGAFAATHRRRIQEAVTLKVLGATRKDVLRAYLVEYGLLGLSAGVVATLIGTAAGWAMMRYALKGSLGFYPGTVALFVALCLLVTLIGGFVGTARALGSRAAPYLREE